MKHLSSRIRHQFSAKNTYSHRWVWNDGFESDDPEAGNKESTEEGVALKSLLKNVRGILDNPSTPQEAVTQLLEKISAAKTEYEQATEEKFRPKEFIEALDSLTKILNTVSQDPLKVAEDDLGDFSTNWKNKRELAKALSESLGGLGEKVSDNIKEANANIQIEAKKLNQLNTDISKNQGEKKNKEGNKKKLEVALNKLKKELTDRDTTLTRERNAYQSVSSKLEEKTNELQTATDSFRGNISKKKSSEQYLEKKVEIASLTTTLSKANQLTDAKNTYYGKIVKSKEFIEKNGAEQTQMEAGISQFNSEIETINTNLNTQNESRTATNRQHEILKQQLSVLEKSAEILEVFEGILQIVKPELAKEATVVIAEAFAVRGAVTEASQEGSNQPEPGEPEVVRNNTPPEEGSQEGNFSVPIHDSTSGDAPSIPINSDKSAESAEVKFATRKDYQQIKELKSMGGKILDIGKDDYKTLPGDIEIPDNTPIIVFEADKKALIKCNDVWYIASIGQGKVQEPWDTEGAKEFLAGKELQLLYCNANKSWGRFKGVVPDINITKQNGEDAIQFSISKGTTNSKPLKFLKNLLDNQQLSTIKETGGENNMLGNAINAKDGDATITVASSQIHVTVNDKTSLYDFKVGKKALLSNFITLGDNQKTAE